MYPPSAPVRGRHVYPSLGKASVHLCVAGVYTPALAKRCSGWQVCTPSGGKTLFRVAGVYTPALATHSSGGRGVHPSLGSFWQGPSRGACSQDPGAASSSASSWSAARDPVAPGGTSLGKAQTVSCPCCTCKWQGCAPQPWQSTVQCGRNVRPSLGCPLAGVQQGPRWPASRGSQWRQQRLRRRTLWPRATPSWDNVYTE